MTNQGELFPRGLDLNLSLRLKEAGMSRAAEARAVQLEALRTIAESIARRRLSRECTADDIQRYLVQFDIAIPKGPHWGSIFKGSEWQFTGKRVESELPSNHGRELKVWRLK